MKNFCTFYIVRHGETEWNKKFLVQGHKDSPLTEDGIKQAQSLAENFSDINFDLIFSSDLPRALKTAEIIAVRKMIPIKTTQALRERNYGIFEGKTKEELASFNEKYEKLYNKPKYSQTTEEGIENNEHFVNRFVSFIRETASENIGKNILLVTHNGVLTMILVNLEYAKIKDLPPGSVKNSAQIKLLSDGKEFIIAETKGVELRKK